VNHPDFVPDNPERIVATALPAGAPWRARLQEVSDRIRHKILITEPDQIALKKGAILKLSVPSEALSTPGAKLFAEISGHRSDVTNFWLRPEPNVILTRRLEPGPHTLRAVVLAPGGSAGFSEVAAITAVADETNELKVTVKPGLAVHGKLDDRVPRPVKNGRVIAHVWPRNLKPEESPPQWHAWTQVKEDGTFSISSLPPGDLEILAMCDGFVSTNGPGMFKMRYPQKHVLDTNDLNILVGMEPTARLEVTVTDEKGRPLQGVRVVTWPNARYGEWAAVILMEDCYNQSDFLLNPELNRLMPMKVTSDLAGISDNNGLAVLPNLPADVKELAAEHPNYELPAIPKAIGIGTGQGRYATFTLVAGQTNHLSIQLQPRGKPIGHY
jgi:hypothetical protein